MANYTILFETNESDKSPAARWTTRPEPEPRLEGLLSAVSQTALGTVVAFSTVFSCVRPANGQSASGWRTSSSLVSSISPPRRTNLSRARQSAASIRAEFERARRETRSREARLAEAQDLDL